MYLYSLCTSRLQDVSFYLSKHFDQDPWLPLYTRISANFPWKKSLPLLLLYQPCMTRKIFVVYSLLQDRISVCVSSQFTPRIRKCSSPKFKKKKKKAGDHYLTSDTFSPPWNFGSSNPCGSTALWYFQKFFYFIRHFFLQWAHLPAVSITSFLGVEVITTSF